jgi:hypothetical protein
MTPIIHRQTMSMLEAAFRRLIRIFGAPQVPLSCILPIPYGINYGEMGQHCSLPCFFLIVLSSGIECRAQFSDTLVTEPNAYVTNKEDKQ